MARFEVAGLDEVIKEMTQMGQLTGQVAKKMLLVGAEEVKKAWKESAEAHELRDTGEMIASIGYAQQPKDAGGMLTIDIYPQKTDRRGIRNAEKAFILHYGTSSIEKTLWVDDADRISTEKAVPAMIAVWDDFIKNGKA